MRERFNFAEGLCPQAESLSRSTVALPFYTALEAADQERVVAALEAAVSQAHS
jgi:dTDP-4-amino-4,6-dideoxygalactose transaminase